MGMDLTALARVREIEQAEISRLGAILKGLGRGDDRADK